MNSKTLLISIFTLLLSVNLFAQRQDKNKLKALKIAHITEQLDLSETEAQAFWPIYNANEDLIEQVRKEAEAARRNIRPDALTEAQAKAHLDALIKMEETRLKLHKDFYAKLQKVLSAKKIMRLMAAERAFRLRMLKEFKNRHRGDRGLPRD